jgi:adenylate cyclase
MPARILNRFALFTLLTSFCYLPGLWAQSQDKDSALAVQHSLLNSSDTAARRNALAAVINHYYTAKMPDSLVVYGNRLLQLYRDRGDSGTALSSSFNMASALYALGAREQGARLLRGTDQHFQKKGDYSTLSKIYAMLGDVEHLSHRKPETALDYYNQVIALYRQGKPTDLWATQFALQQAASIHTIKGAYTTALELCNLNIEFAETKAPQYLGNAYFTQLALYEAVGNTEKAVDILHRALQLFPEQPYALAQLQGKLASIYARQDQNDSGRIYLEASIRNYKLAQQHSDAANALNQLAYMYDAQGNTQRAKELADEALSLVAPGSPQHQSILFLQMAKSIASFTDSYKEPAALPATGRTELSNRLKSAVRIYDSVLAQNLLPRQQELIFSLFAGGYRLLGDYQPAYYYLEQSTTLRDSLYRSENLKEFALKEAAIQQEQEMSRVRLEEETKRLELQKEMELRALKFEFERRQAEAHTEEERRLLLQAEALKRKEIEIRYEEEQKALALNFEKEKEIARIEREKKEAIAAAELQRSRNVRNWSALGVVLATILLGIATWSYLQKRKDNKRIAQEKQKSDDLLLNILPYEIAEELKEKGSTSARQFDEVSVLFTDFINFTANAENKGVQELINELNIYFTAFDHIMARHGLEKIKTIGDAYLAVSGLPVADKRHAHKAVAASLEIVEFVRSRKALHPDTLEIRVGIHSGPVIAGIVGVRKFAYDIWGDTVNTAARMEQNGQSGKVNISATTYQLVQHDFAFEHRGKIATKGKGELEMYFVSAASK